MAADKESRARTRRRTRASTMVVTPVELRGRGWLFRTVKVNAYVLETVAAVAALVIFNMGFLPGYPGFLGLEPNPFWAVILLVTCRYGFRAGLLSSLLSSATYLGLVSTRIADDVIAVRDMFTWEYSRPAVLFIVGGVVLGMIVQRHLNQRDALRQENEMLVQDNQVIRQGEEQLRDLNLELANRVVVASDTLPMLYKYAKKLNVPDVDEIFTALTELVVEVIKAGRVSVYAMEDRELTLHSRNGQRAYGPGLALEPKLSKALLGRRQVVTLADMMRWGIQRQDLFLCGPMTAGPDGRVLGLLAVEGVSFVHYNPASARLFKVIVDWASTSLASAAEIQQFPAARKLSRARSEVLRSRRASLRPDLQYPHQGLEPVPQAPPGQAVKPPPRPAPPASPPPRPQAPPPTPAPDPAQWAEWFSVRDPQVYEKSPVSVYLRPRGRDAEPPPVNPLLDATAEDFAMLDAALSEVGERDAVPSPADPPPLNLQQREAIQHMLKGELEDASSQGRPITALLHEIDEYVMDRAESSRPKRRPQPPNLAVGAKGKG